MDPSPLDRPETGGGAESQQNLLRILALKRHEGPPRGFFDRLPNRVLVNIRAGSEVQDTPWWSRLWESVLGEPMVVTSYAAFVMGAVLFGVSVYHTAVAPEWHPAEMAFREALPGATPLDTTFSTSAAASLPPLSATPVASSWPAGGPWMEPDPHARPGLVRYFHAGYGGPEGIQSLPLHGASYPGNSLRLDR